MKPVYWVVATPVSAVGAIGYFAMSIQLLPLSWHAVQPEVTPAWICAVVGAGVANRLPGAASVAFAAMIPEGVAA